MRSSKSRSRSKANRPRSLGNIINRVFDSSGPEGKVRGTPQQIIEKYQILARDAQLSNDRVAAENFMQHAEHYTRLLGEAMREMAAEQEERQRQHGQGGGQSNPQGSGQYGNGNGNGNGGNGNRDRNDGWRDRADSRDQRDDDGAPYVIDTSGGDDNLVDTPETRPQQQPRRDDQRRDDRGERRRDDRPRDDRPRDDRPRDDRPRDDRPRDDRPRDDRPRDDRPREDRGERRRDDRPRDDRPRDDRPREDRREPRPSEAAPVPQAHAEPAADAQADKPKKPRAPRKPKADAAGGGDGSQEAAE